MAFSHICFDWKYATNAEPDPVIRTKDDSEKFSKNDLIFLNLPYFDRTIGSSELDGFIDTCDSECYDKNVSTLKFNNMNIKSKNKSFSIKLITNCIYEPCLTTGEYDKTMSNGCFRIDLYNNIFFHCGTYKYQLPLFFLNQLFQM